MKKISAVLMPVLLIAVQAFAGNFVTPTAPLPVNIGGPGSFLKWQADGTLAADYFGSAISMVEDVNGDLINDIIVGAFFAGATDIGSAFVYSGADGALLYQKDGELANDHFGVAVFNAGDVNGDGRGDFIVGANLADPGAVLNAGSAYVYSGADGALLYQKNGAVANDWFGFYVSTAGDVNGDGKDDFIVGAPRADPAALANAGSAYVYSGADGTLLYQKDGAAAGDEFGHTVGAAGDVNGDGKDDFIVGAWKSDPLAKANAGSAYVYSGLDGSLLYQKEGAVAGDLFGHSVSTAGDMDGDGKADFMIGATGAPAGSFTGSVYIYSGVDGSLIYQKNGSVGGSYFGQSIASGGDVDGDSTPDFIIGAPSAAAGSLYVYSGADGSLIFQKNGSAAGVYFGYSVSGAADMNGDGKADFVTVELYHDPSGITDAGSAYVFLTDFVAPAVTDNQPGDNMPYSADPGAVFDVDFSGTGSDLNNVQYTVWDASGMSGGTGTEVIAWTNIATGIGSSSYTTDWGVAFGSLIEGTNFVSARAYDVAGNISSNATDVFYIIKDVTRATINPWTPATYTVIITTAPTITFTTNENSSCRWELTDNSYVAMPGGNACTGAGSPSQSCAVSGLTANATNSIYIACSDTAGNEDTAGSNAGGDYFVDTLLPTQSTWTPATGTAMITTAPTVTFTTDENATCRWELTDNNYSAMPGGNACTGAGTTAQSCAVTGMTANATNTLYISCSDSAGNENTAGNNTEGDYKVDTAPPAQSVWTPATGTVIVTSTPTVTLTTNENASCRWELSDNSYSAMPGGNVCAGAGTTAQSCAVTGLTADATNTVYISCADTAGNEDTAGTNTGGDYFADTLAPAQSAWAPSTSTALVTTSPIILFTTDENASCRWSLADEAYSAMAGDCTGDGTTTQSCSTSGIIEGPEVIYIACADIYGNEDDASTNENLSYLVDITPPSISAGLNPASGATVITSTPAIAFTISENGDCKWSLSDQTYSAMTGDCTGDGTTSHSCSLAGLTEGVNAVHVACKDIPGNQDTAGTNDDLSYTLDTTPPVPGSFSPAVGATLTTISPTVTFTTDENADCRWSLTDLGYAAMPGANDCSGAGSTSQSCSVSGFVLGTNTVSFACLDMFGNLDTAASNEDISYVISDITAPTQPAFVNDGTAQDIDFTDSVTELSANWGASSDPESDILRYWYALGTTSGATDVVGWTDIGNNTSATKNGLALTDGDSYFFTVKAENGVGLYSDPVNSDGVTVDLTAPVVSIISPADAGTVSGNVVITGTISDISLAEWKLYFNTAAQTAAWTEIASGAGNIAAGTLYIWDTSSLAGDYSIKLTATDGIGSTSEVIQAVTIYNTTTVTGTLPEFTWLLMSMQVQPDPADPVSIFGADKEYKIYRRDPTSEPVEYFNQYRVPQSLKPGDAFWIKAYYEDMPYSYSGSITDSTENYSLPVYSGWNQIGTPFNRSYQWGLVKVKDGASTYDLQTAASLNLISTTLYGYDVDENSWALLDAATDMSVQTGYDIRAYKNLELIFDPEAGQLARMKIVRPRFDYHVKISAASKNSADLDNFIGATASSDSEYDAGDAEEPPRTLAREWTSLYFPRDTWTRNAGRYASDLRSSARKKGDAETWTFNVETSETGELVTLTWDNASLPDTYSFSLINTDTGEQINMAEQNSYSYTAGPGNISEAHFRIDVVKLEAEPLVTKTFTLNPGWNLISVPVDPEITGTLEQLGDNLPVLNVFQLFSGKFYPAQSADIQAGIGYWIHVAENTEIDITGIAVPDNQSIELPMKSGWNLIGNPFDSALPWGDNILVKTDTATLQLSEAVSQGIISRDIFRFDGQTYTRQTAGASLAPWAGYFLNASTDATLVLKK